MRIGPAGLWRHADFVKFWTAQTISVLGTQVTALALPLTAILLLAASPLQIGLLATVQYLPFLLFGLPAGALVDRLPRRTVLIATDLGRVALLLTVPAAHALHVLHIELVYGVAFGIGALTVLFDAAHQAYLPSLVARDQLVDGNTKLQISYSGSQVVGAGMGGALVQLVTAPVALIFDAASYAGSALLLLLVRHREHPRDGVVEERQGLVRAIRGGLRHVLGHELIRPIALGSALSGFFDLNGVAGAVLMIYAIRVLLLSPALLGLTVAVASVGSVLGALAYGPIVRLLGVGRTLLTASLAPGIAFLAMPFASPRTALLVLGPAMILIGFSSGVFDVGYISLRQTVTPARLQGRMNATVRFVIWGLIPAGSFTGGVLGQQVGVRVTLWVAGAGSLLQLLPMLLSPVRALRGLSSLTRPPTPLSGAERP